MWSPLDCKITILHLHTYSLKGSQGPALLYNSAQWQPCPHTHTCMSSDSHFWVLGSSYTVNDKSFKGEKFHGLLGSSGMWGKVSQFFPIMTLIHTFMIFQLYKTATSVSMKASCSSCEFSLKLSLAYSEMDESTCITETCVQISCFKCSRMTMQSQEKSYSWSESEMKQTTNRFLVSFFSKLFPNLLAETL